MWIPIQLRSAHKTVQSRKESICKLCSATVQNILENVERESGHNQTKVMIHLSRNLIGYQQPTAIQVSQ